MERDGFQGVCEVEFGWRLCDGFGKGARDPKEPFGLRGKEFVNNLAQAKSLSFGSPPD